MVGPWFTVVTLGKTNACEGIWIHDGSSNTRGRITLHAQWPEE